jgi:hypothetical protein
MSSEAEESAMEKEQEEAGEVHLRTDEDAEADAMEIQEGPMTYSLKKDLESIFPEPPKQALDLEAPHHGDSLVTLLIRAEREVRASARSRPTSSRLLY